MTFAIAVDDRFRLPRFGNALLQAIVGKVIMVFGEGLILGPTPSPAVRRLRALSGCSHGEGPRHKNRPSPNHSKTFPTCPGDLPQ